REGGHHFEWTHRRLGGEEFAATVQLTRMGSAGQTFLHATVRDITARKRAEEALREGEALQRLLMDNLSAGVAIVDARTHVIERMNPAAAGLFGAPVEQIEGRVCHRVLSPTPDGCCPITDLGQAVDNADRIMLRADGSSVPVLKSVKRIQIGGEDKLLETFVDITDRKRAEQELAAERRRLADILEGTNVGTWEWNVQTGETTLNERWAEIIGYTLEEIS
ncbi:MAG: PAS domain S-box protein, partial [bacterium]|nr:PAS domain S-box protein [bacterium]